MRQVVRSTAIVFLSCQVKTDGLISQAQSDGPFVLLGFLQYDGAWIYMYVQVTLLSDKTINSR